jgi:hypothetical protein
MGVDFSRLLRSIVALCAAAALCALLVSCGGPSTTTGPTTTTQSKDLLLGRWMDTKTGAGYEFKAERKMATIIKGDELAGSYRVVGDKLTMTAGEVTLEATWKVSGDTLQLTLEGMPTAAFKRQ